MNNYHNHSFLNFLKSGHGGAYLMIRYEEDAEKRQEYRTALIHAALHDLRYDSQCFNERSGYLWDMIALFPDRDDIVAEILRRAATDLPQEIPFWDFIHRLDLFGRLKAEGYGEAEDVLTQYYDTLWDYLHGRPKVRLCWDEDMQKMEELANRLGKPIPETEQESPVPDTPDPKKKWEGRPSLPKNVEELIAALRKDHRLPYYSNTLRKLTDTEIRQLADAALAEEDVSERSNLFSAFAMVDYPYDPAPLIRVARENLPKTDDMEVPVSVHQRFWNTHRALERLRHPAVREYGEWLLTSRPPETCRRLGLRILVRNYLPTDRERIWMWRNNSIASEAEGNTLWGTDWHEIDSGIVEAAKTDPHRFDPDFFPLIYYTTLCPHERMAAFTIMEELGMLNAFMLEESIHDSEETLRDKAKELLHSRT